MKKAELREYTVGELKDMARGFEISGFSTMNKEELVDAVSKANRKADKALAKAKKDAAKESAKEKRAEAKGKDPKPEKAKPPKEQFAHESVSNWGSKSAVTDFEPAHTEYLLAAAAAILSPRGNPAGSPQAIEETRQFWAAGGEKFLEAYKAESPNAPAPHIMVRVKRAKAE